LLRGFHGTTALRALAFSRPASLTTSTGTGEAVMSPGMMLPVSNLSKALRPSLAATIRSQRRLGAAGACFPADPWANRGY